MRAIRTSGSMLLLLAVVGHVAGTVVAFLWVDVVPHLGVRRTRLRRGKISSTTQEILFRHYRPQAVRSLLRPNQISFPHSLDSQVRYPALMPANFTTLDHFSVSSARCLPNSVAVIGNNSPPSSASRDVSLGSLSPSVISRLSLEIISGGVFRGAPIPYQALAS
jgi:hypothetical protein